MLYFFYIVQEKKEIILEKIKVKKLGTLQIDMLNFLSKLSIEVNEKGIDKIDILSNEKIYSETTIYKIIGSIKIGFDFSLIEEQIKFYRFSKEYEKSLIFCFEKICNSEKFIISDILKNENVA